jgi:hypothetical protein
LEAYKQTLFCKAARRIRFTSPRPVIEDVVAEEKRTSRPYCCIMGIPIPRGTIDDGDRSPYMFVYQDVWAFLGEERDLIEEEQSRHICRLISF